MPTPPDPSAADPLTFDPPVVNSSHRPSVDASWNRSDSSPSAPDSSPYSPDSSPSDRKWNPAIVAKGPQMTFDLRPSDTPPDVRTANSQSAT